MIKDIKPVTLKTFVKILNLGGLPIDKKELLKFLKKNNYFYDNNKANRIYIQNGFFVKSDLVYNARYKMKIFTETKITKKGMLEIRRKLNIAAMKGKENANI